MKIRAHIRKLQILENEAVDRAGVVFRLTDIDKMITNNKASNKIARKMVKDLEKEITPEIIKAAKMGKTLYKEVMPNGK